MSMGAYCQQIFGCVREGFLSKFDGRLNGEKWYKIRRGTLFFGETKEKLTVHNPTRGDLSTIIVYFVDSTVHSFYWLGFGSSNPGEYTKAWKKSCRPNGGTLPE